MRALYFSPSLLYYRVIKALEDTGAMRLTNKRKFKHHSIKVPTFTPTDRIIQVTRQLTAAIQGTNEPPPNELKAIEHLRTLIVANSSVHPLSTPSAPAPAKVPTEAPNIAPTATPILVAAALPVHSHLLP